jgi:hypothetical protein
MEQEAKQTLDKINGLKTQFKSVLDDFNKYYVYYNKNPEVDEFQKNYLNSKNQLQNILKELFSLSDNVTKETENLNKVIEQTNRKITIEKILNNKLNTMVTGLTSTNNSSQVLIDDSKEEYNNQYMMLWEMILGLLLVGGILAYKFPSKEFIEKCTQYVKAKTSGS